MWPLSPALHHTYLVLPHIPGIPLYRWTWMTLSQCELNVWPLSPALHHTPHIPGITTHTWYYHTHITHWYYHTHTPGITTHPWYYHTSLVLPDTPGITTHPWYYRTHLVLPHIPGITTLTHTWYYHTHPRLSVWTLLGHSLVMLQNFLPAFSFGQVCAHMLALFRDRGLFPTYSLH